MNTLRTLAHTALAPITWGTSYLVTTELLPDGRPLLTATLRALPAGIALLALTRVLPRGDWWWKAAVLGTLNIGAFFALMFVSAYRLPGGIAATLAAVHPLVTALLAGAVLHERVSPLARAAAGAGVAGVALLVITPSARLDAWGILAGLGAALCTSAGVMLTKRWGRPVPMLAFTGWQLVAGGLVLLVPLLALEGLPSGLTANNLLGYAWLAIPGTAIAYLLWFGGILKPSCDPGEPAEFPHTADGGRARVVDPRSVAERHPTRGRRRGPRGRRGRSIRRTPPGRHPRRGPRRVSAG
ncbi:EamA family transporter [Demequina litorisediminis]|uniref:EamA domain-containing protein n=1 Tax=Demequina litorisediminis TaxID=1849022 RepID=A0ABQ6IJY9_9MICO|nr:EamA family transporter [Demequina litorisediminis]GMA37620.1 hypothetical protein GCM10025876_38240 [Demequina litorisediminis]